MCIAEPPPGMEFSRQALDKELMTPALVCTAILGRSVGVLTYLWIAIGSALGGMARFAASRAVANIDCTR